ncbi:MAG TPA: hypothetical protein VN752_07830 [Solirubrobacterales bacterium]|nr:hypothetical protein [Solirubrobacterales bacterium]
MKQGKVIIVALALLALAAPAAAAANAARGRVLLDRSFGSAGVLIKPDFGEQRIALDGYGRVLTADGSSDGFQIVRYLPSGRPDTRFGLNGIAEIPLRTDWGEVVTAIRVQPDGKILVAGSYVAELGEGEYQGTAVLARLEADGSIDEGFGGFGGFRERPGLIATRGIDAMLVQRGKIVAAGGNGHGYVARFNPDGSHDRSFSRNGWASVPPLESGRIYPTNRFTGVSGLVAGRGGSLFATGWAKEKLMVAHLRANGRFVRQFGSGGIVHTDVVSYPPCHCLHASGVARDRRGRLLIVGTTNAASGWSTKVAPRMVVLARYWPTGKLDHSFGGDGVVYAGVASSTFGNGVAIQRDGRIVVAGSGAKAHRGTADGPARFIVFRFLPDGRRDQSFFGDGIFAARFGAFSSRATQALVQQDGRVVVAGWGIFQPPYSDLRGLIARFRVEH